MANQEHFDLLKQGVEHWNQWRQEHPGVRPDLSEALLIGVDLGGAELGGADLRGANLFEADLRGANLTEAKCSKASLSKASLSGASLSGASLTEADLTEANLTEANLTGANLSFADLREANLSFADLREANLSFAHLMEADLSRVTLVEADLSGASLSGATLGDTIFGEVDLSDVHGLETVHHMSRSIIGIETIFRSQGRIPEGFLRGAGVEEIFIEYMSALVNRPIEFYSAFISYSTKDQEFVERLYTNLQGKGIRCWFAPHHLPIGEKIRDYIDRSIRHHDKVLLILSTHAVESTWVESEVETALDIEKQAREQGTERQVLFPIRLDDSVLQTKRAWAKEMRHRNIGDFTRWEEHDAYQQAFQRLLRDLTRRKPGENTLLLSGR
ncbi:MAG: toll/interleukin-1 receptor domain-containing protein [Chloroflexota bacterium]|nr:toll/interleukin-1 receptor domain-containing protein [Chloroflexota bacterium]